MCTSINSQDKQISETMYLKSFVKSLGVDLVGVANLRLLDGMPVGLPSNSIEFLRRYRYAIVMGVQLGKFGKKVSGTEVNLYLEKVALEIMAYLEEKRYYSLIIHTEDEFDPINRIGLISLKVLAKEAGLGWQGRSLLIVSPEYGPIHRLIAVITDMPLEPDHTITSKCGDCKLCVQKCPERALTLSYFEDRPANREDVLDIIACKGDSGCRVCIEVCPWKSTGNERI